MGLGAWCIVEANDLNWVKPIPVHEVGHGLGLPHEHQRANAAGTSWEVPLCPNEKAIYDNETADEALLRGPAVGQELHEVDRPTIPTPS